MSQHCHWKLDKEHSVAAAASFVVYEMRASQAPPPRQSHIYSSQSSESDYELG